MAVFSSLHKKHHFNGPWWWKSFIFLLLLLRKYREEENCKFWSSWTLTQRFTQEEWWTASGPQQHPQKVTRNLLRTISYIKSAILLFLKQEFLWILSQYQIKKIVCFWEADDSGHFFVWWWFSVKSSGCMPTWRSRYPLWLDIFKWMRQNFCGKAHLKQNFKTMRWKCNKNIKQKLMELIVLMVDSCGQILKDKSKMQFHES